MPKVIAIVVLLVLAVMFIQAMRGSPADERIVELTTRHAEQQVFQNQRLAALQQQWQTERSDLYQQRDQLEAERKDLAVERQREPIIAQSIQQVGTLALGLLPLAVCALLLRRTHDPDEADTVAETLVTDLMSPHPVLLAREVSPDPTAGQLGSVGDEPPTRLEPPSP